MFLYPRVPETQELDGFLYKGLLQWMNSFGKGFPVVYSFVAFALLYIQAIGINRLMNEQRLMQKPNYLTGMSYLLITSLFVDWFYLSSPLIVNTLLIWVLSKLCNLYNDPNPKSSLFNMGLVIGLATFFYIPSIAFLLLIIVGLGITRTFRLPEWLMVLFGLLTPYYFLGAWVFLADRWKGLGLPPLSVSVPRFNQGAWAYTAMTMVLLTVLVGIYFIQNNMRRQVVQARKNWNLVFLYLIVAVIVPFLNASQQFDYWILTAVPIAAMAGAAFLYPERKWFALVMHWGMVVISLIIGYYLS